MGLSYVPHGQGTEAVGIPRGDEGFIRENQQRVGALGLAKGRDDRVLKRAGLGPVDESQEHLAVRRTGEGVAIGDEPGTQVLGVGEIPVVADTRTPSTCSRRATFSWSTWVEASPPAA